MNFVFEFTPTRLDQTLVEIRGKHPTQGMVSEGSGARELGALLDQLHRLRTPEEIQSWTFRRKQFELYALATAWGICQPGDWPKLGQVLHLRWRDGYLKGIWGALQKRPDATDLILELAKLLTGRSFRTFLGDDGGIVDGWLVSEQFLISAESYILSELSPLTLQLERYAILPDSPLARLMTISVLTRSPARRLLAEPDRDFIAALKILIKAEDEVLIAFRNYLLQLTVIQWDARRVLGDHILPYLAEHPRLKQRLLDQLPSDKREILRQRLIHMSVERAFAQDTDNERLTFWLKFEKHLLDEVIRIEPETGLEEAYAFNFGKFGVIEFNPMGAAYFYHPVDFKRITSRTPRNVGELKQFKDVAGYFDVYQGYNRFTHQGDWAYRHSYTVSKLLR